MLTICQHSFHYACYMRWLATASTNLRPCCPTCHANLLSDNRYWVHVTTNTGNKSYTDITKEVEERFLAVRLARQQIFFDCFSTLRHLDIAPLLLAGPDAVDVNYRAPIGGWTALHLCAMRNDVAGVNFLLSHGADKSRLDDNGLLAIDCAKSINALGVVEQLS
ncbi:hypothetical protein DFH06DRAFT_271991 [Mycena polygramma]|nr:hypothetical protein DFH06DRAFT_271991 [Mycena polygramma]